MYLSVYLFTNKPTWPHKVDFVIGNRKRGGGGIREESLLQKLTSKWGRWGLLERGGGGGFYSIHVIHIKMTDSSENRD